MARRGPSQAGRVRPPGDDVSEPLPACPYTKRGNHEINVIMPEHDTKPVLLFCAACGITCRQVMDVPPPLDDFPADAIAKMTAR
jgi:hypothetical protein